MFIRLILYTLLIFSASAADSPTAASTLQISCQAVANYSSVFIEANARLSIVYHEAESSFLIIYTNRSSSGMRGSPSGDIIKNSLFHPKGTPSIYDQESLISIAYGGSGSSPWSNMVINVSDSPNAPTPIWADSYGVCSG